MKIKATNKHKSARPIVILPILKKKGIKQRLRQISKVYGIKATFLSKHFKADFNEVCQVPVSKTTTLILLGIGSNSDFTTVRKAFRCLSHKFNDRLSVKIGIDLLNGNLPRSKKDLAPITEAAVTGLLLGTYAIGQYKTTLKPKHPLNSAKAGLTILVNKSAWSPCLKAAQKGVFSAETQARIFDLVNAPGNKLTPDELAFQARESGKRNGFKVTVFNKVQIKKEGLHTLMAVNRGSEYPPAFIIMEYKPESQSKKKLKQIGLVGKGVTFDTGGLSIKGSNNMHYMKSDMGGAAAVLGAMELTAKMQLPVHLICIIPATDNCVDAKAIKPGDVINSYSGKTIEVIDTDAEGRLILADGVAYLNKNYKPDVMIDVATLTGSVIQALGYKAGGLFTKNAELGRKLSQAGEKVGERLWPLPIWDAYASDIQSDVADVKNFSGRPIAGAIAAAKFIEAFTGNHKAWAHLDIAGMAFGDSPFSNMKSATGYGANLLVEFIRKF